MLLTLHKAASTYVGWVLSGLFSRFGYQPYDPSTEAFSAGVGDSQHLAVHAEELLQPNRFFGALRSDAARCAAQISDARPIIHVRDPRDCIVSLYYSLRYSHTVPTGPQEQPFLDRRRELESMSVDAFARNMAFETCLIGEPYSRTLAVLRQLAETRGDAVLSKYEDMVMEFPDWILALVDQILGQVDYGPALDVIAEADFLVNLRVEEDLYRHKRQVMPGDHKRKLTPATQKLLTDCFADDLRFFGYLS